MATVQALARDLSADERTIRRAIRDGTLRARRVAPRTVRVQEGEAEYLREHWPLLAALRSALRTERNTRLAVVFGSVSRGTETAESDVDILVALRDSSPSRVAALESKITRAAGREAHVVLLEHVLRDAPQLAIAATNEGRVLADRDGRWPALQARRRSLERRVRERRARDGREAAESLELLAAV